MRYNPSIIPSRLNDGLPPEFVREPPFFLKWGYLVVEDALAPEHVARLRSALDETFGRIGAQFTHHLLEEDDRFAFLLDHPPVLRRIRALLGTCLQLHS